MTFGPFITAQLMRLDIATGQLQWGNAGHQAPLLIRDRSVVQALENPGTLPVGFGGATPVISEHPRRRGDQVLFFTDGAIEEHKPGGQQFGMEHLIDFAGRAGQVGEGVQEMVRGLSHALARARDGVTIGDTTLFLVEWRGSPAPRHHGHAITLTRHAEPGQRLRRVCPPPPKKPRMPRCLPASGGRLAR